MKKILAGVAVLLVAVGAAVFWPRDRVVEAPPPVVEATPLPVGPPFEPLEPVRPLDQPPKFPVHWGGCASAAQRTTAEDAWLKRVLASTIQNDPQFGVAAWSMEAAECAARRWRLSGQ